ncbi:T9SS type A sorting domain-containing protein [uncultured Dokdonia sp.]|uniref:T9SS type A sorting domain-containing protein n=1 Tax=uncultured Dokdonia sp. TaxID=575653 RepID=UPI0026370F5A|nr:T9SS type A sorting domain-containing protein [uncultured Dokdonia sp.]
MKKITLFIASMVFATTSYAQIQTEDFEGDTLPDGWTSNIIGGTAEWAFGSPAMPTGDPFTSNAAIFDDDGAGSASVGGGELISPAIDLTGYADASVTYEYSLQDFIGDGFLKVDVWDGAEWQEIALYDDADIAPTMESAIDVTSFINDAFQVRFTYDDEGAWAWGAGVDTFSIDGTLSTESNTINGFSMFPNPAADVLNVTAASTISSVKVMNLLGQVVVNQRIDALSDAINVSDLKSGAYLVQVTAEGQTGTYKFIKQ